MYLLISLTYFGRQPVTGRSFLCCYGWRLCLRWWLVHRRFWRRLCASRCCGLTCTGTINRLLNILVVSVLSQFAFAFFGWQQTVHYCIIFCTIIIAVPTRWVPDVKFHSLHVGKSHVNSVIKPISNDNPDTNSNLTLSLLNPTDPHTGTVKQELIRRWDSGRELWFTAFSLPGQFAPRSESANRTLANSLPGTFAPWLIRSLALLLPGLVTWLIE